MTFGDIFWWSLVIFVDISENFWNDQFHTTLRFVCLSTAKGGFNMVTFGDMSWFVMVSSNQFAEVPPILNELKIANFH